MEIDLAYIVVLAQYRIILKEEAFSMGFVDYETDQFSWKKRVKRIIFIMTQSRKQQLNQLCVSRLQFCPYS